MIESYKSVVKSYAYSMPDQMNEPLTEAQYDQVSAAIPGEVETNYQLYLESLEKPMPFFIGVPVIEDNKLKLAWDVSYDFDAEDITYTVEVAKPDSTLSGCVQAINPDIHRMPLIIM